MHIEIILTHLTNVLGKKYGPEKSIFISTFSETSVAQLNEIFYVYPNVTGDDIETEIENKFSKDILFLDLASEGLLTIGEYQV